MSCHVSFSSYELENLCLSVCKPLGDNSKHISNNEAALINLAVADPLTTNVTYHITGYINWLTCHIT